MRPPGGSLDCDTDAVAGAAGAAGWRAGAGLSGGGAGLAPTSEWRSTCFALGARFGVLRFVDVLRGSGCGAGCSASAAGGSAGGAGGVAGTGAGAGGVVGAGSGAGGAAAGGASSTIGAASGSVGDSVSTGGP